MWYRRRRHAWCELPEEVAAAEPDDDDPALLARMPAALGQLPAPQRLVLVLHYLEGMSYEQTAEFLDVPIGTVMSRLHRARRALREVVEGAHRDEEASMGDDDRFKREIQAEIAVLLEMFGRQSGAAERLTVILQHSPQRFEQLIAQAGDEVTRENLALLLPRLGTEAMTAVLDAALSPDAEAAGRGGDVLRRFLRGYRPPGGPGWDQRTPGPAVYALADRLIHHAAEPAAKVELLVDLLEAREDNSPFSAVASLITNVPLCFPQAALTVLVEWFQGALGRDDLYDSPWLLHALCRTGTPFCREVADHLASPDVPRQVAGLAGAEAIGRCLDAPWLQAATPEEWAYDEQDLTRRIAAVCIDYSLARRRLVDEGWMVRQDGMYELTEQGRIGWRVERFVAEHYLK